MISNTTKLERLAQAVFRYGSIKKALFSFFYNPCKVPFLGFFALFGNGLVRRPTNLPIDTYRQTDKKRTAPSDAVIFEGKRRQKL